MFTYNYEIWGCKNTAAELLFTYLQFWTLNMISNLYMPSFILLSFQFFSFI